MVKERVNVDHLSDRFESCSVQTNVISCSNSSCLIEYGAVRVIVSMQTALAEPSVNSPNEGFFSVSVESSDANLAASIKSGVNDLEKELGQVLSRGEIVDLKTLCVHPAKLAWVLYCDILILECPPDAQLIQPTLIGLLTCLRSCRLPSVTYKLSEDEQPGLDLSRVAVDDSEKAQRPVATRNAILGFAFGVLATEGEPKLLVDPTGSEGKAGTRISVVVDQTGRMHGLRQWGGEGTGVSDKVMGRIVALAKQRYSKVMRLIEEAEKA